MLDRTRAQPRHDSMEEMPVRIASCYLHRARYGNGKDFLSHREQRGHRPGGWVNFSLMQLHPKRFHSKEPWWADRLAVLAVGDQTTKIPASLSRHTQGPNVSAGTVVRGQQTKSATEKRPTIPAGHHGETVRRWADRPIGSRPSHGRATEYKDPSPESIRRGPKTWNP